MSAARPLRPRSASALGGPLVHIDVVGSTNDRARELAAAGAPHGTVVVAEEQTAGRGRQGRRWLAPRGRALTFSVVIEVGRPEQLDAGDAALLPVAAGVAVAEACEAVAPVRCRLKWPNDVWIGDRKLAGILIEARPGEGWAVIGIGINVDTDAHELGPELREAATSLRIASKAPVPRDAVFEVLLERLGDRLRLLGGGDAETLLRAFRDRDALLERRIAWTAGDRRRVGKAEGIDDSGNLIVLTDDGGRVVLQAGEVHLDPGAAAGET
jgi:BirA family biotin operon repressor/biotin-[acetyl-CoA-carboxylase] ligase